MKKCIVFILFSFLMVSLSAQTDLRNIVRKVSTRSGSQMYSIFDASPESPDGKLLCYTYFPVLAQGGYEASAESEVIVKDLETGHELSLCKSYGANHNGTNAIWINNNTIAVQTPKGTQFEVFNARNGESLFGVIDGWLPHKSHEDLLYFSRCRGVGVAKDAGVWELNCRSGKLRQVISQRDLYLALHAINEKITNENISLLHVDASPANARIAVGYRYRPKGKKKFIPILAYFDQNGKNVGFLKSRPMHPVWFDDDSFFGVFTDEDQKRISRYNLAGKRIEVLAGTSTHVGASPDRLWYAGEGSYYGPEADGHTRVYLYRRSCEKPVALLADWTNNKISWTWKAHISTSFSADGKRLYFTRVTNDNRSEAMVVDLTDFLNKYEFDNLNKEQWNEALNDTMTSNWSRNWIKDGETATLTQSKNGLTVKAGLRMNNNADHVVLWTKKSFKGDVMIEYDFTRLDADTLANSVNIIYVQATGTDVGIYDKDILKWSELRRVPAMKEYFNHMNTYHISYAVRGDPSFDEYVRARRYIPLAKKGLDGTELFPEYTGRSGVFEIGQTYHITVIKFGNRLIMNVKGTKNERTFSFQTDSLPLISEGHIGLRQMWRRESNYKNFKVYTR